MNEQTVNISTQQIVQSAQAGVAFLNLKSTMIPGDMKKQLDVLEAVLTGVGRGQLVVVSADQVKVESTDDGAGAGPNDEGNTDADPDNETDPA